MEENPIFHSPWGITSMNPDELMNMRRPIVFDGSSYSTISIPTFEEYHSLYQAKHVCPDWAKDEKGGPNTKVYYKEKTLQGNEYVITCDDVKDLSIEYILKNLSKIKGKLMMVCAPIRVNHFECKMTPEVRKNIITAYKKLNMYGKEPPIIARFDDFGNRLLDKINIDTIQGMNLKIVNPDDYGPYYFEIKAICERYEPEMDITEKDLPF